MLTDRIRRILEPLRRDGIFDSSVAMAKGRVIERDVDSCSIKWLVTNKNDEIQLAQAREGFYELAELRRLRSDVGPRSSVLDVGANIGNHSVFFLSFFDCRQLTCVEPFFEAFSHLLANISLNSAPGLDVRVRACALGDNDGRASLVSPSRFNMGLTRVDSLGVEGDTPVFTGDRLVGSEPVDLVKIDVEGMELQVLRGMDLLLSRQRPAVYVEVSASTRQPAIDLMDSHRYVLVRDSPAYGTQSNLTFMPR